MLGFHCFSNHTGDDEFLEYLIVRSRKRQLFTYSLLASAVAYSAIYDASSRRLFYLKCPNYSELAKYMLRLSNLTFVHVYESQNLVSAPVPPLVKKQRFSKQRPAERSKHANTLHLAALRSIKCIQSFWFKGIDSHSSTSSGNMTRQIPFLSFGAVQVALPRAI